MMKRLIYLCLWLASPNCRSADVVFLHQTTVDTAALTFARGHETRFGLTANGVSHQQFPLQTYRGYQYATYYDDERQVCVARRKLPHGQWEVIRFGDYHITTSDSHNTSVIGICENDGTIHLAFDHHVSDLHYRVSSPGVANDPEACTWDPSLFGPVTATLGPLGKVTRVTYPRFIPMPNGNLMFYYRHVTSGNGDGIIRVYDGNAAQWSTGHGKFIARDIGTYTFQGKTSTFRYAYLNGIGYAGGRLHVSWVWRERFERTHPGNQHDLCYAYSDDDGRTWKNSTGARIGVTGTSPIHVDSPGVVVAPIALRTGLSNQNTQYAYPDGAIHVVVLNRRQDVYHHHWRDAAGAWRVEVLPFGGARPELLGDQERNLFLVFADANQLCIAKGVPNTDVSGWSWSQIYRQANPSLVGEGQIDLIRWQRERILSVYGQEAPPTILDYGPGSPVDGLPTPLHVTDFQVAGQAAQPNPPHRAMRVSAGAALEWAAGLDAVSHRVYLGTDSHTVATATTDSQEYRGEQTGTRFVPAKPFAPKSTYYWRIDQRTSGGGVRSGLLWSFTAGTGLPLDSAPE